jgi:hypothetical protein
MRNRAEPDGFISIRPRCIAAISVAGNNQPNRKLAGALIASAEGNRIPPKTGKHMDDEDHGDEAQTSAEQPRVAITYKPRRGQFRPGQSGNPTGRPRNPKNAAEVRELAREKTGAMLEFLSRTALNPKVPINARITCAIEVVNRAYGKPQQSLDLNHGVQSALAQLLEEIDGKNKIRTIEGSVIRPALAIEQPLLDHGQGGQESAVSPELGTDESSE